MVRVAGKWRRDNTLGPPLTTNFAKRASLGCYTVIFQMLLGHKLIKRLFLVLKKPFICELDNKISE